MWTYRGLKRRYGKRIMRQMEEIAAECRKAGYFTDGPFDQSGDSYAYGLIVKRRDVKDPEAAGAVDITFTICESEEYDGSENGVNFSVDIVEYSVSIIGGLCPYNYTPEVWVNLDDIAAIDRRFEIMMDADTSEIAALIKAHKED